MLTKFFIYWREHVHKQKQNVLYYIKRSKEHMFTWNGILPLEFPGNGSRKKSRQGRKRKKR